MGGGGRRQEIVIVSGAPGSGKTTLAVPLAEHLGFALIAKDEIKEAMFSALGAAAGDVAQSQRYGAAAMELLWVLMRRCPQVVLESNFRNEFARPQLLAVHASIVELHCQCEPNELLERITNRAPTRHAAHWDREWLQGARGGDTTGEPDGPIGIGAVELVDTTAAVDVERLAIRVSALLAAG